MHDTSFVGREQTIEALGKTWKFSRCALEHWTEFRDWAVTQLPDPKKSGIDLLAMLPMDDVESRREAVRATLATSNNWLSVGSDALVNVMSMPEGLAKMMQILAKEHQPETTHADGWQLVMFLGQSKAHEIAAVAAGKAPKKEQSPGEGKTPATNERKKRWTGQQSSGA